MSKSWREIQLENALGALLQSLDHPELDVDFLIKYNLTESILLGFAALDGDETTIYACDLHSHQLNGGPCRNCYIKEDDKPSEQDVFNFCKDFY